MRSPDDEREQRMKLSAVYRIFARLGMDDLIYTHISARIPGSKAHFLLNPFGLMSEEVTASNLVKVDLEGNKVTLGHPYDINHAGYAIHSALHEALPNAYCVMNLHTDYGVAVSAQREGLLPLSQFHVFQYGGVAYHDYEGIAFDTDQKERLVADLGQRRMMILRNHGTLAWGESIEECFFHMLNLERACKVQILAQGSGRAELNPIDAKKMARFQAAKPQNGHCATFGVKEFEAWMRKLDRECPDYRD